MPHHAIRRAALGLTLALTLGACSSLTDEEERKLEGHRQNAMIYLRGQDFAQARRQARMGLEIDPDDYQSLINYALASGYLAGDDFNELRNAQISYERAYDERDSDEHDPVFLVEYAKIEQRLAAKERQLALALEDDARNEGLDEDEREKRLARAEGLTELAERRSDTAEKVLKVLIERQELERTANRILMAIAAERGELDAAIAYGRTSLEKLQEQREYFEAVVENDFEFRRERASREALKELDKEELIVRSLLAEILVKSGRIEDAITELDIVIEKDPSRSDDYYNRGRAHEELGHTERARSDFQLFITTRETLDTSDPRVLHAFKFADGGS